MQAEPSPDLGRRPSCPSLCAAIRDQGQLRARAGEELFLYTWRSKLYVQHWGCHGGGQRSRTREESGKSAPALNLTYRLAKQTPFSDTVTCAGPWASPTHMLTISDSSSQWCECFLERQSGKDHFLLPHVSCELWQLRLTRRSSGRLLKPPGPPGPARLPTPSPAPAQSCAVNRGLLTRLLKPPAEGLPQGWLTRSLVLRMDPP